MAKNANTEKSNGAESAAEPRTCGVMMPISEIEGCPAEHWAEVKEIIFEAVESTKDPLFKPGLVSDGDAIGVIQKRIVEAAYGSDIVICDVSAKNPNVMFELGLRIAFDKPTVIVKDDRTDYSFDTGIIEHITYPRDLRFSKIVKFKKLLAEKVAKTYNASTSDPNHSPFLKNFGQFKIAALPETEATATQVILDKLNELQSDVAVLKSRVSTRRALTPGTGALNRLAGVLNNDPNQVASTATPADIEKIRQNLESLWNKFSVPDNQRK